MKSAKNALRINKREFRGWCVHDQYDGPVCTAEKYCIKEEQVLRICNPANVEDLTLLTMVSRIRVWRYPGFDETYSFGIDNCSCGYCTCIHPDRENRTVGFLTMDDAKRAAIEEFKAMEQASRQAVDDALTQLGNP
jgi:hypothetical protein